MRAKILVGNNDGFILTVLWRMLIRYSLALGNNSLVTREEEKSHVKRQMRFLGYNLLSCHYVL